MTVPSISLGVGGSLQLVLWLLLAAALGLAVWAYRAPEPPLRRGLRVLLAALRFAALAILILILFQPVMTVAGRGAARPRLPVLVDLSRSMQLPAAAAEADSASRLERSAAALAGILPQLEQRFDVQLYGFGAAVGELERRPGGLPVLAATGGATRLGAALSEVLGRRTAAPPSLCLLLSDGAANDGPDPVTAATRLGVPIYVVPASGDSVVNDLWVAECRVNRSAFLGQVAPLAVRIGSTLPVAARTRVLLAKDGRVLGGEHVTLPAGAGETEVELQLTPEQLGTQRYEIRIEPVAGELTLRNNQRSVALEVVEERLQVLVVAGELSWDVTFLRRALDGDRTLETTLLARLEREDDLYRPVGEGKLRELPERAQELLPFGAVVLIGVDTARLPAATRAALRAYVAEGGGLVVLAGRQGERLRSFERGELAGRLPVGVLGPAAPGLVAPELTAAGLVHPITAWDESPARAEALWSELPPIPATVLMESMLGGEVLVEGEAGGQRTALVVAGPSGGGRALVIAASELWRWSLPMRGRNREATVFRRFLTEAVRWTAEGRQHGNLELFADKSIFLGGEAVAVGARLTDDRLQPVDDAAIELEITGEEGATAPPVVVRLLPGETRGLYRGRAGFLPAGVYRLRGTARRGTGSWTAEGGRFMVDTADLEGATPAANPALLRRLAQRSGGGVLDAATAGEQLAAVAAERQARLAAVEIRLWNHPSLFLACVGLLAGEWLLRRRFGLA